MRTQRKKTSKPPKAQGNEGDQVVMGFSFTFDQLSEWGEFVDQSQSEVEQNQSNSNTQLKISPKRSTE